jgi:hypothetical protein
MIKLSAIFRVLSIVTLLTSCSGAPSNKSEEISLKADRSLIEKYRTETPEDIKDENDFMALVLKDMSGLNTRPQDVRDHYYREVRKKRESFNNQYRKIREKFNRDEKKKRDEYLANSKKERNSFTSSKHQSSESSDFFQEQNVKRNAFFQDQSDTRKEFESQMESTKKDFNEDMNLKQKQFDDAYREFSKNYADKEKEKRLQKSVASPSTTMSPQPGVMEAMPSATYPGQDKDLQEFDNLKETKRDNLGQ